MEKLTIDYLRGLHSGFILERVNRTTKVRVVKPRKRNAVCFVCKNRFDGEKMVEMVTHNERILKECMTCYCFRKNRE